MILLYFVTEKFKTLLFFFTGDDQVWCWQFTVSVNTQMLSPTINISQKSKVTKNLNADTFIYCRPAKSHSRKPHNRKENANSWQFVHKGNPNQKNLCHCITAFTTFDVHTHQVSCFLSFTNKSQHFSTFRAFENRNLPHTGVS